MRIKQIKKTVMNVYIHHSFFINLFYRSPGKSKGFSRMDFHSDKYGKELQKFNL